eukprot:CAMPEP_0119052606 /NCGR_PEP_ID=MMETSP1177-20130426/73847_1 /TAXON_ID=2985 /ORGANISM="Ochromonas sp, Strain CCMP1899" /LENGTH=555 /DNA_ID=CAMNT_0007032237 /DNA_START=128 /DNA_END=1796 /DNA_ORIENTATION=-
MRNTVTRFSRNNVAKLTSSHSTAATCPVTGTGSSGSSTNSENSRPYKQIPGPKIYPVLGSILDFKESGGTMLSTSSSYYKKYGAIVKQNVTGNEVIIFNPIEYLKVHRAEGKYPSGMAVNFWPFVKYSKTHRMSDILKQGLEWKKIRTITQTDLLSPQAAASYLPSLLEVSRQASVAFPSSASIPQDFTSRVAFDMEGLMQKYIDTSSLLEVSRQASVAFPSSASIPQDFTSRVAFDMFTLSTLGKSRGMTNQTASKEDQEFITNSTDCMRYAGLLAYSPKEGLMQKYIDTSDYKKFELATDMVYKRSVELVQEAMLEHTEDLPGVVSDNESYLKRLLKSGNLSTEEVGAEVAGLLLAAVDTTSNYMNWIMLHLARNPDKQEKLAKELKEILKGGDYNKDQPLPYLQACYRESHRLTPVQLGIFRYLDEPIDLNGYNIPVGTKLTFNLEAIQKDPSYVDTPEVYSPERWLAEAVESRKGTPSEILDHRLLATPFSFGPRMCLGGRLAELEIKTLFARLVQDWEFTIAPDSPEVKVHEFLFLTPLPSPKFEIKRRV